MLAPIFMRAIGRVCFWSAMRWSYRLVIQAVVAKMDSLSYSVVFHVDDGELLVDDDDCEVREQSAWNGEGEGTGS